MRIMRFSGKVSVGPDRQTLNINTLDLIRYVSESNKKVTVPEEKTVRVCSCLPC